MARYCPLFSGSEGNCTYIGNADAGILIDAGVSAKRIETALAARGIDPRRIAAVFVTHEHSDHIAGLKVLTKRYGMRVYATRGTMEALCEGEKVAAGTACFALPADGRTKVQEGGCEITAFTTPHDSRQSCGYRIHTADDRTVAVATDIGNMTATVREAIRGCDLIQIESNHDIPMLLGGPYPDFLKQRILAVTGHLSNPACAAELVGLAKSGTTRFVLAHLSQHNNRPDLALSTARTALSEGGLLEGADYLLRVASPEDTRGIMVF